MQIANVLLHLSGDAGNTVPKYGVTAAEVAVLRHIHGDDAVVDIEPTGEVTRSHKSERERLLEVFGRNEDGRFAAPAVERLFPGAAARVFERFDELDLPEDMFKAQTRARATAAPVEEPEVAKPVAEPAKKPAKGKKVEAAPEPEPEEVTDEVEEDDGIGAMPDRNLFK